MQLDDCDRFTVARIPQSALRAYYTLFKRFVSLHRGGR